MEQYECMFFPGDFVSAQKNAKGDYITKSFKVEKATLIYKANKLESFILKSRGNEQAAFSIKQIISETSYVKRFWIDKSGRYFVALSFPPDINNGLNIMIISNID